mgnify:CR=1 FL=1
MWDFYNELLLTRKKLNDIQSSNITKEIITKEINATYETTSYENIICDNVYNYIYILKEREFVKTNEQIYKIGKTHQKPFLRFKKYPKGSKLEMFISVDDADAKEKLALNVFTENFVKRKEIGQEYFSGDLNDMKKILFDLCKQV